MSRVRRLRTGAGAIGGQLPVGAARRAPFVALVAVVLLGALLCLLMLNTLSAANELEQQSIADTNSVTKAQAQELRVDLAARRAPAALARAATALGMVPADKPAFLRIGSDGSVTLLGVPGAVAPPPIALQPPAAGSTALIPGATPTTAAGTATTPAGTATTTPTAPASGATPAPTPAATPAPTPAATRAPSATVTLPGGAR